MSITKREAAVISAYTGVMLGDFTDMHAYAEEVFGHPVWTHQFGSQQITDSLKELARPDFITLDVEK